MPINGHNKLVFYNRDTNEIIDKDLKTQQAGLISGEWVGDYLAIEASTPDGVVTKSYHTPGNNSDQLEQYTSINCVGFAGLTTSGEIYCGHGLKSLDSNSVVTKDAVRYDLESHEYEVIAENDDKVKYLYDYSSQPYRVNNTYVNFPPSTYRLEQIGGGTNDVRSASALKAAAKDILWFEFVEDEKHLGSKGIQAT